MHPASEKPAVLRFFAFLIAVVVALVAAVVAASLYDRLVLGEHSLAIGKAPLYTPYYLARMGLALLFALLMIGGLHALRDPATTLARPALGAGKRLAAYLVLGAATACTLLFVANPHLYYEWALEDGALEWSSALLPLTASLVMAYAFWRVLRSERRDGQRSLMLAFSGIFAAGLFVIGMEEISWMQRVFEIATPAAFAGNQQQEMNLHNMHSILFGMSHKIAMYAGLIVLPFIAEVAPRNALVQWIEDFLPSRFVLALSAPFAAFNYNGWNFFLTPVTVFLTVTVLAYYIQAARRRGDRGETALFAALLAFVVLGQAAYLAYGHTSVRMWDNSEYGELFMALGLAWFTWETAMRLVSRYGKQAAPFGAVAAE
jgi:hypothetical protein